MRCFQRSDGGPIRQGDGKGSGKKQAAQSESCRGNPDRHAVPLGSVAAIAIRGHRGWFRLC